MPYIHDLRDNYTQINILSIAAVIIFILLWVLVFLSVVFKMYFNRNKNEYYDNTYYFILGKAKNIFEEVLRKEVQVQFNDKMEEKEDDIQDIYDFQELNKKLYDEKIAKAEESISVVEKYNDELIDDLDKMNSYLTDVQEYIQKKNEMNQDNIDELSEMLKSRLKTYVLGMFQTMKVLSYQINNAYVTPVLANMISPLKGLYENVKGSLMKNEDLIKKTLPFDYNNEILKDFEGKFQKSDGPADLSASFENSEDFFMGYK